MSGGGDRQWRNIVRSGAGEGGIAVERDRWDGRLVLDQLGNSLMSLAGPQEVAMETHAPPRIYDVFIPLELPLPVVVIIHRYSTIAERTDH